MPNLVVVRLSCQKKGGTDRQADTQTHKGTLQLDIVEAVPSKIMKFVNDTHFCLEINNMATLMNWSRGLKNGRLRIESCMPRVEHVGLSITHRVIYA